MELYIVDPQYAYTRSALIEHFESFIWTDRYAAFGDLQLVVEPTKTMLELLKPDVLIGTDLSDRLMRIESAYKTEDETGRMKLTIVGKSLESLLKDRTAKRWLNNTTVWNIAGTPGHIIFTMVNDICVTGIGLDVGEIIPDLVCYESSGSTGSYLVSPKGGPLYDRVKELCETFDLGIRITTNYGVQELVFQVYSGTDKTGESGVTFSADLENLANVSHLNSNASYKNTAFVISDNGGRVVSLDGYFHSGLNRRGILVDATDIKTVAGADLDKQLDQRGRDALANAKPVDLYDGTANPFGPYVFNSDYFLGDLVDLMGDTGVRQPMRVTEHIWASDAEGFKTYPTLSSIN